MIPEITTEVTDWLNGGALGVTAERSYFPEVDLASFTGSKVWVSDAPTPTETTLASRTQRQDEIPIAVLYRRKLAGLSLAECDAAMSECEAVAARLFNHQLAGAAWVRQTMQVAKGNLAQELIFAALIEVTYRSN